MKIVRDTSAYRVCSCFYTEKKSCEHKYIYKLIIYSFDLNIYEFIRIKYRR